MNATIETKSGAVYEFAGDKVRRVSTDATKRGDGEWQPLVTMFPKTPVVGSPMVLVLESLKRYGGDDWGTPEYDASDTTTRRTTEVVSVRLSPDARSEES